MIEIIEANPSLKKEVLEILDEFRKFCTFADNPKSTKITNTATLYGGDLFDALITSDTYKIFLAIESGKIIGIITGFILPQLRKGEYCLEIEEFYVRELYHGKGVAGKLMDTLINWGKEKGTKTVRLESGIKLSRGHAFYKKYGFIEYGKAFLKTL